MAIEYYNYLNCEKQIYFQCKLKSILSKDKVKALLVKKLYLE